MHVYVRNNNKNIRFVVPNLNKSFLFTITEKEEQRRKLTPTVMTVTFKN